MLVLPPFQLPGPASITWGNFTTSIRSKSSDGNTNTVQTVLDVPPVQRPRYLSGQSGVFRATLHRLPDWDCSIFGCGGGRGHYACDGGCGYFLLRRRLQSLWLRRKTRRDGGLVLHQIVHEQSQLPNQRRDDRHGVHPTALKTRRGRGMNSETSHRSSRSDLSLPGGPQLAVPRRYPDGLLRVDDHVDELRR